MVGVREARDEFEALLALFPMTMYSSQMPEIRYQVAVQAYTAAYVKKLN
jgi:hypothetical protein